MNEAESPTISQQTTPETSKEDSPSTRSSSSAWKRWESIIQLCSTDSPEDSIFSTEEETGTVINSLGTIGSFFDVQANALSIRFGVEDAKWILQQCDEWPEDAQDQESTLDAFQHSFSDALSALVSEACDASAVFYANVPVVWTQGKDCQGHFVIYTENQECVPVQFEDCSYASSKRWIETCLHSTRWFFFRFVYLAFDAVKAQQMLHSIETPYNPSNINHSFVEFIQLCRWAVQRGYSLYQVRQLAEIFMFAPTVDGQSLQSRIFEMCTSFGTLVDADLRQRVQCSQILYVYTLEPEWERAFILCGFEEQWNFESAYFEDMRALYRAFGASIADALNTHSLPNKEQLPVVLSHSKKIPVWPCLPQPERLATYIFCPHEIPAEYTVQTVHSIPLNTALKKEVIRVFQHLSKEGLYRPEALEFLDELCAQIHETPHAIPQAEVDALHDKSTHQEPSESFFSSPTEPFEQPPSVRQLLRRVRKGVRRVKEHIEEELGTTSK